VARPADIPYALAISPLIARKTEQTNRTGADRVRIAPMRKAPSNSRAIARALRRLHKTDRLDEVGDALATLVVTSALLVDEAMSPTSDMAGYARARVLATHGQLLGQLNEQLAPTLGGQSAMDQFLASLAEPSYGSFGDTRYWSAPPDDGM
jgi:hypothetical protein